MGTGVRVVLLLPFSFALSKGVEANQALNSINVHCVTRSNSKLHQRPRKIGIFAAYLFINKGVVQSNIDLYNINFIYCRKQAIWL